MLKGIQVFPGIVLGLLRVFAPFCPEIRADVCPPGSAQNQRSAYFRGKETAARELRGLAEHCVRRDAADIFRAHLEILDDAAMEDDILAAIDDQGLSVQEAVDQVYRLYAGAVERAKDPVIRERARDLQDIRIRMLRCLQGVEDNGLYGISSPCIIAAKEFLPSQLAQLDPSVVLGIVSEEGSATCHAAILAQSLGLPAVFGVTGLITQAKNSLPAILDADQGELFLAPDSKTWTEYSRRAEASRLRRERAASNLPKEAITADGRKIEILINLGDTQIPKELSYCDGIGLLRSEFLYMQSDHLPTEEEQFLAYRRVLEGAAGKPVTVRTLDIGGDKALEYLPLPKEENPFLGFRAIRLCFARPELLRTQLRALLRASVYGQLRLMFPMIGSLEDWRRAHQAFRNVSRELQQEGIPVSPNIRLGAMIEIPSAALMAPLLAKEMDFASVGTNDLCQYLFAADRTNCEVADYAQKYAPVFLRLLEHIVQAFEAQGKPLSICGELGGDDLATAVLVGMGFRKLSMSPSRISFVKQIICTGQFSQMQELAQEVMRQPDQAQARLLMEAYRNHTLLPQEHSPQ